MNILIVSAHPDDEVLGAGGTVSRFKREGHSIHYLILDKGRTDKIDQVFDTLPLKHFITKIEEALKQYQPELVFTHFLGDLNRDHQIVAEATLVACRPHSQVKEILSYETVGSAGISLSPFKPDTYVVLDAIDVQDKISRMEKDYPEELRTFPHPRSTLGIETLLSLRGSEVHETYAEAFMTLRRKL